MSNDKMREEFEAWYTGEYLISGETILRAYDAQGGKAEHYQRFEEEMQWRAWKASRAALVVELPKILGAAGDPDTGKVIGAVYDPVELRDAIQAQGLRVKP